MANGNDYGWAYVGSGLLTGSGGPIGSLQFGTSGNDLSGSSSLVYNSTSNSLVLSGNLNVSGVINANALNIDVTNKTVTNISATGSTKFGDSADDKHIFSGSIIISSSTNPLSIIGIQSGSLAGSGSFIGLDSNNNFILTSVSQSIRSVHNRAENRLLTVASNTQDLDAEATLTFNGSILSLTGEMTASVGVSSSFGQFNELSGTVITNGTVVMRAGDISSVRSLSATNLTGTIATAAQTNITSVGELTSLVVDSTTLIVNSTSHRVGIGRSSPQRMLDISHSSDPQLRLTNNGNVYSELQTTTAGNLYLTASGGRIGLGTSIPTAFLAVSGASHFSGNVGIGTTSPTKKLDVIGDTRITGDLVVSGTLSARVTDFKVTANTLTFGDSPSDSLVFNSATASVVNGLNFDSNTFVIDSANNRVGVGVEFPDASLEVLSTSTQLKLSYDQTNNTTFTVDASGDLNINPHGPNITSSADLFVSGNTNLGFDDTTRVKVKGRLSASVSISSSLGTYTRVSSSRLNMLGGNISSVGLVDATTLNGTLQTSAQPNITSVGTLVNLAVDSPTFVVKSTTHRVGIGRTGPQRILEISHSTEPQLRLTNNNAVFSEFQTNTSGNLHISSSGGNVGIGTATPTDTLSVSGTLAITGSLSIKSGSTVIINNLSLASTTTSSFLALDSNNNLILTSSGKVVTEYVSASILNYTNPADNRIVTSVDATSVNAEANLTFNGNVLSVTGELTSSIGISSSMGRFTEVSSSHITDGSLLISSGQITKASLLSGSNITSHEITSSHGKFNTVIGTLATAAQPNITSVGNLVNLTSDTTTLVVKSTTSRVGIGRTGPQRKLDVFNSAAEPQVRVSYDASNFAELQTTSQGFFTISASNGRVGIGAIAPQHALTVEGEISASSNVSASFFYGDGSKLTGITTGISYSRRAVTGHITASISDVLLGVTASAAVQILLPLASAYTAGQYFTVKDESGLANSNNITILTSGSNKIDGRTSVILESPYGALNIYTDGTNNFFIY